MTRRRRTPALLQQRMSCDRQDIFCVRFRERCRETAAKRRAPGARRAWMRRADRRRTTACGFAFGEPTGSCRRLFLLAAGWLAGVATDKPHATPLRFWSACPDQGWARHRTSRHDIAVGDASARSPLGSREEHPPDLGRVRSSSSVDALTSDGRPRVPISNQVWGGGCRGALEAA